MTATSLFIWIVLLLLLGMLLILADKTKLWFDRPHGQESI
jgi:hypothetical protein